MQYDCAFCFIAQDEKVNISSQRTVHVPVLYKILTSTTFTVSQKNIFLAIYSDYFIDGVLGHLYFIFHVI